MRCVLITNILNSSYAIIRRTKTGSPCPLASLTWSPSRWHFWRDARNIYYLQGYTGDTVKYAYVQQVVVSSTIVHRSCLSRGLERVTRAELCGQCRIYARWQGTSFWFILNRTMYVPLFNYNTLTNIPNPVDIIPSPNPNVPLSSAIPAAELALNGTHNNFPPITYYLLVSARTLALVHSPSYTPSKFKTKT